MVKSMAVLVAFAAALTLGCARHAALVCQAVAPSTMVCIDAQDYKDLQDAQ